MTRLISVVLAVLVVASAFLAAPTTAKPPAAIAGDVDFAMPDWGLKHGWMHLDVTGAKTANGPLAGIVRWVEVNDNLEVRYVRAVPTCLSFSEDGTSAVLTVRIQERLGWGDGTAGQYVNFWLHDGGTPGAGRDQFATPFWPPQDSVPGCTYAEASENLITAAAGNFTIRK